MKKKLACFVWVTSLVSGELPPDLQARFFKILTASSSLPKQVACVDAKLIEALKKAGFEIDDGAKIAWGANASEVKKYKSMGKMVMCPTLELFASGGSMAVVEEGGKPAIYLHKGNLSASGVTLGDSILKLGKFVQ